jgi:transcriptional regulator with XRE-family HTH domain
MQILTIGSSIRLARNSKSLSIEELANLSGVSRNAIWEIEKGIKSPTLTTLEKLSAALEIDSWRIVRHAYKSKVAQAQVSAFNPEQQLR